MPLSVIRRFDPVARKSGIHPNRVRSMRGGSMTVGWSDRAESLRSAGQGCIDLAEEHVDVLGVLAPGWGHPSVIEETISSVVANQPAASSSGVPSVPAEAISGTLPDSMAYTRREPRTTSPTVCSLT